MMGLYFAWGWFVEIFTVFLPVCCDFGLLFLWLFLVVLQKKRVYFSELVTKVPVISFDSWDLRGQAFNVAFLVSLYFVALFNDVVDANDQLSNLFVKLKPIFLWGFAFLCMSKVSLALLKEFDLLHEKNIFFVKQIDAAFALLLSR